MRRISVVGNTGSGKTTMSRAIADALDLPHLELDALHHGPGWAARPDEEMRQAATEFASREKWVIDGNYTSIVADIVWSRADTLVWLDLPRRLVTGRVIRRSLRRVVTREELWAGNRERWHNLIDPRPDVNVILWSWTRDSQVREKYTRMSEDGTWDHLHVIRLAGQEAVGEFLDQFA